MLVFQQTSIQQFTRRLFWHNTRHIPIATDELYLATRRCHGGVVWPVVVATNSRGSGRVFDGRRHSSRRGNFLVGKCSCLIGRGADTCEIFKRKILIL